MEVVKKSKQKEKKKAEKELQLKHSFYTVLTNRDGEYKGIEINRLEMLNVLSNNGFYRYDINPKEDAYVFIRVKDKIVEQVSITQIRDWWFDYIENLPDFWFPILAQDQEGNQKKILITSDILINKFLGAIGNYLSEQILDRLTGQNEIEFLKDSKNKKHLFYRNGFVRIDPKGVHFEADYKKLDGFIWRSQVLNRDYNPGLTKEDGSHSFFAKFCYNISGKDIQRYMALQTIIGYLMHDFRDYKLKAPILTDAFLGDDGEANGRTGKGVFTMGLKYMLNSFDNEFSDIYTNINGKNFDPKDKHRYSDCGLNTTMVHIEDVKAYTNIENFFNDITEGVIVDKKNEKPFRITPKIVFSSNKSIRIEGGSAKDRTIFYEFADHYNSEFSPQDEFKHWFFKEWNKTEWQKYDAFMCYSVNEFLKAGKIVPAKVINLTRRVVLEHSGKDFVTFMDYYNFTDQDHDNKLEAGSLITQGRPTFEYKKKDLYEDFIQSYPDYQKQRGFGQARFTRWIKLYCESSNILEPIRPEDERRSSGQDYITFRLKTELNQ